MRIVALADIHNDIENMFQYLDKVEVLNPDVIISPGDFTDVTPDYLDKNEIVSIIIEELKSLGKPVVTVPGNLDRDVIEVLEKKTIFVHGSGEVIDGVGFYGYGGARTPFNTSLEPSEEELSLGLENSFREIEGAETKIQVTHMPPFGTKLDMIATGDHVGSVSIRSFVESKRPTLCVCAHIHEARGVDLVNNVVCINPGRFPEGYCGFVELDGKKVVKVDVVSLI